MKRLFAVFVGGLGMGAFWRRKRRKSVAVELGPDPAEGLRAKLAESKAASDEAPPAEKPEPEEAEPSTLDPASRREDVHERARAALDELS